MEFEPWHIWTIAALSLLILEIFTPAFLAASLATGCFLAAAFAALDFGLKAELIGFTLGTLISFFRVRPFVLKYGHKTSNIKTNVDALVGKTGKVVVAIDNSKNQGRVIVEGDDWRAESTSDIYIAEGEKVEILNVKSTILTVDKI